MAPQSTTANKIIDAALKLAETRNWREISTLEIATEAKVSLAQMRGEFSSKTSVLKAFIAQIDAAVLENYQEDLVDEIARDRLFDVLMLRLETMEPHKSALKNILPNIKRDPALALELSGTLFRSAKWMLIAAGLEAHGAKGFVRERGVALVFGKTLEVWLEDDDAGLAKTMVELDKQLRRGEDWLRNLQGPLSGLKLAKGFAKSFASVVCNRRSKRGQEDPVTSS